MKERLPSSDFPLPKDAPLSAEAVVEAIGTYSRQFATSREGTTDFPQPVRVITRDSREITAYLTSLFADTASQADGTFYFDRDVREAEDIRRTNFLWGREIDALTIVSDRTSIPEVEENSFIVMHEVSRHPDRMELREVQDRIMERVRNRDIIEADGSISSNLYILAINVDDDLTDADIAAYAKVRDGRIIDEYELLDWVNEVEGAIQDEGIALGMISRQLSTTDPNWAHRPPDRSMREYSIFFRTHPREVFLKWVSYLYRRNQ